MFDVGYYLFNPNLTTIHPMTINLLLLKWLAKSFARPKPGPAARPHLKQRQMLPTLPQNKRRIVRFQDDDSPPGNRIQWRQ